MKYLLQDKVKIKHGDIYFSGDLHHTLDFLAENVVLLTFIDFLSGTKRLSNAHNYLKTEK